LFFVGVGDVVGFGDEEFVEVVGEDG